MSPKPTIRCAIYTRKSSEEGLDQDFNSLDAQYEACAAYIASQRHEGWKLKSERFDDGGISGGTLERPALKRLLLEIEAGRIDMIVVYKIDRLTRSLADFVKLVERLDATRCSFVSVTQAFNTSSSMGRLTLNVLLSFAQFEREVTAERIRDKIAASKKKGMWMGGLVPLGYDKHPDPKARTLIATDPEAKTIKTLFELYDQLGCLRRVEDKAKALGLRSKARAFASGRKSGGGTLSRGQIYHVLTNPIYLGKIRHKEKIWPGLHSPIIDISLWDRVQTKLQLASARPRGRVPAQKHSGNSNTTSLLTGKIRDETGDRLTPSHTIRRGKRLRYYVSNRLLFGRKDPSGWRLPAPALEHLTIKLITQHLDDCARLHKILQKPDAGSTSLISSRAMLLVKKQRSEDRELVRVLIECVQLTPGKISVVLDKQTIAEALKIPFAKLNPDVLSLTAPFQLRRRGVETRLIAGEHEPVPDATITKALVKAHCWLADLRAGISLSALARNHGHSESYIRTRIQLAFLSPKIQSVFLAGKQPPELSLERIIRAKMPLDWVEQEQLFGFSERKLHSL